MSPLLKPKIVGKHHALNTSFPYYAEHILRIKPKDTSESSTVPFKLNSAQLYLHRIAEQQKKDTGKVRLLVLKGRQQGCSTYIGGRFYHRTTRNKGVAAFILSHETGTTDKLFQMVQRFWEFSVASLRPAKSVSNRKELKFATLVSEYFVGTAGNKNIGRGGTVQLFHGSEVAFWENTEDIKQGVMQSIPPTRDTEVFLESTANGMGNMFHTMCMQALRKEGEYRLVFIPWFWQDEYRKSAPSSGGMALTDEEHIYLETYPEVTTEQIYWRRDMITFFNSISRFKQEYPSNAIEAFQMSGDKLFDAAKIMRARSNTLKPLQTTPNIMGVDPGRTGDATAFAIRQGRKISRQWEINFEKDDTEIQMKIAGQITHLIKVYRLDKVFIDAAEGSGIVDRLHELGYERIVMRVHASQSASEPERFANIRAEMAYKYREWIGCEDGEVDIPDSDTIHTEMAMIPDIVRTSNGRWKLPDKAEIKKDIGHSPNLYDAGALTFAYPVMSRANPMEGRTISMLDKHIDNHVKFRQSIGVDPQRR